MAGKLEAVKFGLAGGIVSGFCVALTTLAGIFGYCAQCTSLIDGIYGSLGYGVSWMGVILGGVYGFVDGFVFAGVFAWIYNKLLK